MDLQQQHALLYLLITLTQYTGLISTLAIVLVTELSNIGPQECKLGVSHMITVQVYFFAIIVEAVDTCDFNPPRIIRRTT